MTQLEFTNNWFESGARPVWDQLLAQFDPAKLLEVGSYEGASACYLISKLGPRHVLDLHCVDTWQGGTEQEYRSHDMAAVEQRFKRNLRLAVAQSPHRVDFTVYQGRSDRVLSKLLADGRGNYFDFIYIDGSHEASDVLCDAVLAFRLLRRGGYLVFDDYNWIASAAGNKDPLRSPKLAIDAFVNIYWRKLRMLNAPVVQIFLVKESD